MSAGRPVLRATPFHARAAAANRDNAWTTRCGATLSEHYDDVEREALCARTNVIVADISWRWRILFEGAAAPQFLSRMVTRDASMLSPGNAFKAVWLSDEGGVRGAGVIARYGRESFLLAATAPDSEWISAVAQSFGVAMREVSNDTGGLAVIGSYAAATLAAAELSVDLEPLTFRKLSWRGIDVTVSRWGEHGGYEIWCEPDDGLLVWDRLMQAGHPFGIAPAGTAALDVLDLEAGVPRPGLDYSPARDGNAAEPSPASLGMDSLIDRSHTGFNGRRAVLAAPSVRTLMGLELDAERPAAFTPVRSGNKVVGHTLRSIYSPALRRAIALVSIDTAFAAPGTVLTLTLPAQFAAPELRETTGRVTSLPFLAAPAPVVA